MNERAARARLLWREGKVTRTVVNGEELWALPLKDAAGRARLIAEGVMCDASK